METKSPNKKANAMVFLMQRFNFSSKIKKLESTA